MFKYILFFWLAVVFIGCSATSNNTTYTTNNSSNKQKVLYINYNVLTEKALKSIFTNTKVPSRIIVTEFVDLNHLENYSKLGYVLSNNIKNTLINKHHATVIEAEVSKYFKISANGLKILSRDINEIRSESFNIKQAIIGTYTYTDKEIVIFVKLIDLKTGIIKGSYAETLPMSNSSRLMLGLTLDKNEMDLF